MFFFFYCAEFFNNHDYFVTIWTRMVKSKVPQFLKGKTSCCNEDKPSKGGGGQL